MKYQQKLIYILLICLSAIFLIHIGTSLGNRFKLDLTDENLYSLSDGTLQILHTLQSPIKMRFYYSKTAANKGAEGIREFNNYALYVQELLKEYVRNSRNNLELDVIDPRPDTPEEEQALAFGLKRFSLTETENYFFGLALVNETGAEKVIEFFDPSKQESLEYEITKLIYSINHTQKKKVGVLSSLPVLNEDMSPYLAQMLRMQGKQPEESWLITTLLKDFYELKKIETNATSIEDVDTLMIVHPKNLSDTTLFAIDQFVLKGGHILLFVDPMAIVDREHANPMMGGGPSQTASNLKKLMTQWGVKLVEGEMAGDLYLAGQGRLNPAMPPTRLLPVLNCDHRCTDSYKDAVSAGLNKLTFIYPGALQTLDLGPDKKIQITPLLGTTDKGNTYKAEGYMLNNPQMLLQSFKEGSQPVILGYKILGNFKSAFPNGLEVEEGEGKNKKTITKKGLLESEKDSAIIVFSDVDFMHDEFAFQKSIFGVAAANQNSNLVLNALESLSGSKELMSVRAKGKFNRGFDVIDQIELEAQKGTENKVNEINASLRKFQSELNQLGQQANQQNLALIQNEGIKKKKELNRQIALLKGQLREVKREGREKVERIGKIFQYINTLLVPIILILFGLIYHRRQKKLRESQS